MKNWKVKQFRELTVAELYEILRSRSEIFVVEQQYICQDLDGMNEKPSMFSARRTAGLQPDCLYSATARCARPDETGSESLRLV